MNNEEWIYKHSEDNKYRYILGEPGERNLICIGVNPSTAEAGIDNFDPTMRRVKKCAESIGYDGYLMVNLYPQRATNPKDMHKTADTDALACNYEALTEVFARPKFDIWTAWGTAVETRKYLMDCLDLIYSAFEKRSGDKDAKWLCLGERTKAGHPRHPLYIAGSAKMQFFPVEEYLTRHFANGKKPALAVYGKEGITPSSLFCCE